jgi:hypothetical protein
MMRVGRGQQYSKKMPQEAALTNNTPWKRMILTSVLAGGLLLAVGGTARADRDWRADCSRRLDADRAKIDRDASRHGEHSRQVDNDVAKMDSDRQWCRDHKADWDHDRFDIGLYIHK